MCFHTSHTKKVTAVENRFDVTLVDEKYRTIYDTPHYHNNGFDHLNSLIIPQQRSNTLIPATWGIVPPNLKVDEIKDYYRQQVKYGSGLNAQSEKLFEYWLYKKVALSRRCIIPVTGFFEPHEHEKKKYPIHIKRKDDDILGLAGIYTVVDNIVTYSILTKEASPLFAQIHNKKKRQPVILTKETEKHWLETQSEKEVIDIINTPYTDNLIEAYAVSNELFNSKVDTNNNEILTQYHPEINFHK